MTLKRKRSKEALQDEIERKSYRRKYNSGKTEAENRKERERYHNKKEAERESERDCLRIINQGITQMTPEETRAVQRLSSKYLEDAVSFKEKINPKMEMCSVCGISVLRSEISFKSWQHESFISLQDCNEPSQWIGYFDDEWKDICGVGVSVKCDSSLKKGEIPKLSRANIPIAEPSETLKSLSYLETLLVSPVLPITYAWSHQSFGQYKSKGQCVAFLNSVDKIAKHLPRHPSDVIINIDSVYGWNEKIRIEYIGKAFFELKYVFKHPAFVGITYSEENSNAIKKLDLQNVAGKEDVSLNDDEVNNTLWSDVLHNKGQNQYVENEIAKTLLNAPISLHEAQTSQAHLKSKIVEFFDSLRSYSRPLHYPDKTVDWAFLFPTLLPDGNGMPLGEHSRVSLKQWIEYVVQLANRQFHCNIPFIFYSNFILRKQRITGVSACKPIAKNVAGAISELVRLSKQKSNFNTTPRSTISYLANQVSFHTNNLPGSVGDMSTFRKNLLSMMSKHGPPTFFLTLSSADTIWPETFAFISGHRMTPDEAISLSSKQRADMISEHPVRTTLAWKKRLNAMIEFLCKGKTKPLGEIRHYAVKAEWQTRCSEHAHLLLWTDANIPNVEIEINAEGIEKMKNTSALLRKAEMYQSNWIPKSSASRKNLNVTGSGNAPDNDSTDDPHATTGVL